MLDPKDGIIEVKNLKESYSEKALVVQSNQLIEGRYEMSLVETRIIHFLISQIKPDDKDFDTYRLYIKDLADVLDMKDEALYTKVKKATKSLLANPLSIPEPGGELQMNWLAQAKYWDNKGCVDLRFAPALKPYLLELKSSFTKHYLSVVFSLTNPYFIRLYMLLKQYEKIGKRTFDIEKLNEILLLTGTSYTVFGNFKSRILLPCQKEFEENKHIDLTFEFKPLKTRQKYTGLEFIIRKKNQNQLPVGDRPSLEQSASLREQLIKLGVSVDSNQRIVAALEENPEHVERCLIHHKNERDKGSKHNTGMIVNWIIGKADIPEGIQTKSERKAAAAAKAKAEEDNGRVEAEQQKQAKEREVRYIDLFESFPKKEQEALLEKAKEKMSSFSLEQIAGKTELHKNVFVQQALWPVLDERFIEFFESIPEKEQEILLEKAKEKMSGFSLEQIAGKTELHKNVFVQQALWKLLDRVFGADGGGNE